MEDQSATNDRRRPSTGWLLSVFFVALAGAYVLLLLFLTFVADLSQVQDLRITSQNEGGTSIVSYAALLLIPAAAVFGALLFFGMKSDEDDEWSESQLAAPVVEEEAVAEIDAEIQPPGVCPNCGQVNPDRAKFCFECGTALAPKPEGGTT